MDAQEHVGEIVDRTNGLEVVDCRSCGFMHLSQIPGEDEHKDIYRDEYYDTIKLNYVDRMEEDRGWWSRCYQDRFEFFAQHLPDDARTLLDIGCGPGVFLDVGEQLGWSTLGIEPSVTAAAYASAQGRNIVNDFFPTCEKDLSHFDVIHSSLVLEHVPDPLSFVREAAALLQPGGLLCIVTPNDYNPLQLAVVSALAIPHWWVGPDHINYFSPSSLDRLLKKVGLDVIATTTTFPMEFFLLMGDNYIGRDGVGRALHAKRKAFEMHLARAGRNDLKVELYEALASMGIGREIVMYARKPCCEAQ